MNIFLCNGVINAFADWLSTYYRDIGAIEIANTDNHFQFFTQPRKIHSKINKSQSEFYLPLKPQKGAI